MVLCFFAQTGYWDRSLTTDNLQARRWMVVNRCYTQKSHEATLSHLLLLCEVARFYGTSFLRYLGLIGIFLVPWLFFFILGFSHICVGEVSFRKLSPVVVFWLMWKEMSRRLFEDKKDNVIRLKSLFLSTWFEWMKVLSSCIGLSFDNFLDSIYLDCESLCQYLLYYFVCNLFL